MMGRCDEVIILKALSKTVALFCLVGLLFCMAPACGTGGGGKTRKAASTPAVSGGGATYYVSTSGSNGNQGTAERPWATPGYGSRRLKAGDTMVIMGRRYSLKTFEEDRITPPSGTAGAWVTVKGEEGNRPVLAGSKDLYSAVDLEGESYVRIENLEITSDDGAPFRCGVTGSGKQVEHVVLEDLYIHHIDEGAMDFQDVNDLRVIGCMITHCGFGCMMGPGAEAGGWRNVVVDGCTLSYSGHYYRGGPGPSPYDRPDGFGIEPSEGPIEIRNTTAEHNRGDGLDSKAANTHIHECVVVNNSCDGVKLWADGSRVENTLIYGTGDGVGGGSPWAGMVLGGTRGARFEIVNVTIHDNPDREAYPIYVDYEGKTPTEVLMRNTIVANGQGEAHFGDSVELTADHNVFFRPGEKTQVYANGREYSAPELASGALGEGNLSKDPRFTRPAWGSKGDYHLKEGSPAVDAGSAEGAPPKDLDGNGRPAGNGYDIGAYEYGSGETSRARIWGHCSVGAASASTSWYLAEGCTGGDFETWVLVENPGDDDADVSLVYLTESGETAGPAFDVEAGSRRSVRISDTVPGAWSVSTRVNADRPVVAERSVYWKRRPGGHSSSGVTWPSGTWYLAEGSTGSGFETWVLIANPGYEAAEARLAFLTDSGEVDGPRLTLKSRSRQTVNVNSSLPDVWSVSTVVTADRPVVAERAMYGRVIR